MSIDPEYPVEVLGNPRGQLDQGPGELADLPAPRLLQRRGARREQDLGLEDESVADDGDVPAIAERLAQPAEEFRAEARELLYFIYQGFVQALGQINDLNVALLRLDLRGFKRRGNAGELLAQGKNNLQAPWLGISAFASLALMLTLLTFIGEAVRDAFDPRKTTL